jgi:hypothetical protein
VDVLKRAAENNPDGAGYAYVDEHGVVQIRKAATYAEIAAELDAALDQYAATSPFLIHFRIATHGAVCEGYSDSKYFANNVISKLPRNWYRTPHWPEYIEDMIGTGNKIVCLYPDALVVLGEKRGNWKNGVWYSNTSGHITFFRGTPSNGTRSYSSASDLYGDDSWDDYGNWRAGGSAYSGSSHAAAGGQAGKVDWKYTGGKSLLVPGGSKYDDDTYDDSWEESVLLMEPEQRRKLLRELMQTDVSDMDDDDIEGFMLSLPILNITNDQDPLELMRDAMMMVD